MGENIFCGLTSEEVARRVAEGKVNGEQTIRTKSVAQIFRENILTFFNLLFTVLAIILIFFVSRDLSGFGNFGFLILIVFNTLVGIVQGLRSKYTMDKLSLLSAPKAVVLRDGIESEIALETIVLDDIMVLTSGRQVCADAVVMEGSCEVNESLITGEPDAIIKHEGDHLMSGSFVVSGKAYCKVEHIGMDNFVMKISAGAKYFKRPSSEIWRSLMLVVKFMSIVIVPVGVALFLIKYLVQDGALNETVLTVIGTLVGMIPSGLVALATTVFCVSVIRLSKHKTLAQDLYCIETLARVDVLCLDKTGTITEGTMEVNGVQPAQGLGEEEFKQILKNVSAALDEDNATALALKSYVNNLNPQGTVENTVPFSSQRKWSGATIDGTSFVMGAPEFVFNATDEFITSTTAEMAQKGYRVLVLASTKNNFIENNLPDNLHFLGFVYITDKIRKEAPETLNFFKEQGVNVKIISGDNPSTVRAVAQRAGLTDCENIIDMSTLKTEEEVYAAADKYTIFGRVLPDQKLMLVKALKSAGHTVAMTGDGVNDVLALKEADCSVAMASGSDAAKNVSSLVLLDSNFASMPKVVAEGRRSINNLESSASLYIMKTLYNTLLAILFMLVPSELPFEPNNLTIIGGVTIGLPSIIIALEPNRNIVKGHFLPKVLGSALPGGVTVLIGAVCVLIAKNTFLQIDVNQTQTMYIVITTFIGLLYLFKVCIPFTWLHGVTYASMVCLFVGCYLVDISRQFFGLQINFTMPMIQTLMVIGLIAVVFFALITKIMSGRNDGKNGVMMNAMSRFKVFRA